MDNFFENHKVDQPTVLFVDDDKTLLEAYQVRFSRLGYNVVVSDNGDEAMQLVKKIPIDVAVLDVTMPRMDGYRLIQALRGILPNLPVVFLTGNSDKNVLVKTFQVKSNCLIEKPCLPRDLDFQLRRLLDSSRVRRAA